MNDDAKDYLDELIELSCRDPEFAVSWKASEARLALARLRRAHNLTQQEVAERMGVARPRVADIERDPFRVSFGRMLRYANALGISLAELEASLQLKRAS